jgi:PAS domain S-box-containing protein
VHRRAQNPVGLLLAVLLPLVALVAQLAMRPFVYSVPFMFFFAAVAGAAWYGGFVPGLLSTFLSALLANYFFVSPYDQFSLAAAGVVSTFLFMSVAGLITALCATLKQRVVERIALLGEERKLRSQIERDTQTLEYRERMLRLITDGLPVWIAYLDPDLRYRWVNRHYEQLFGMSREALAGKRVRDVIGEAMFEERRRQLERALGGETVIFQSLLPPDAHGDRAHALTQYVPDVDGKGHVRGLIILLTDVSELKRSQQLLEQAVQVRDEFLLVAAHELKTPLTSLQLQVSGLLRNLESGTVVDPSRVEARLETADRQVKRLVKLVNELLDVNHVTVSELRLELERVELDDVVREVLDRMKHELTVAGCPVELSLAGSLFGHWDRLRVEQIVGNLVSNAMKYGAGRVITITTRESGGRAQLIVRDRGIGVARENRERIFERFARAVPSDHYGGLGLGLWIVRVLAEAMGGGVSLESAPGQGATFTVELPLQREERDARHLL